MFKRLKPFKSIRSRLTASYLLVILLAMGVAAALAWNALDRAFLEVLRENLLAQAQRVAQTVEAGGASGLAISGLIEGESADEAADEAYSQSANVLPGYHTRVIDEEGVVILDLSTSEALEREEAPPALSPAQYRSFQTNFDVLPEDTRGRSTAIPLAERTEIQRALAGEPATEVRAYSWASDRRVLYAAYPVRTSEDDVVSVVYIASPLPRFSLALLPTTFGPQALGGVALAILLAGLAGLLLARELTRPLRQLTDAASKLAQGESAPVIPPASTDELNRLGVAFNTMNANLAAAYDALAEQARQREAILHGLADAVVAVDAQGDIVLANPPGSTLLESASGPLAEAIQQTLASGEPHAVEIVARDGSAHGQVLELLTAPLHDEDGDIVGAVAVAHDVTPYRQLDRLRINFVSDVSHELRTPLTAIKGFVETLQDGAADDPTVRDRFLDTIAAETERLIRLTNDLLLLTRADAGRLDLRLAPIDLVGCVRRAIAQLEGRALEKHITITLNEITVGEELGNPISVLADADRVHQVLVNLLDNAVKFTPPGGQVTMSIGRGEASPRPYVTVADSGPGIPAEEMVHIFERFYRGDRSRARRPTDGSGLGLAIARVIVEAHGGHLWGESKPGQGAAFTFTLPPAEV